MVAPLSASERRAYLAFSVFIPLLGSALGVNGAAVFQIIAHENLGLSSEQIGLAVGLGAISIPFQVLAARIPLGAAHRNLRTFSVSMAVMCLAMALLMIGSNLSLTAVVVAVIVIAVLAELAVSVLYATSLQPLLSTTVDATSRQWLNGQGRAAAGVVGIGLVALVGSVGRDGRIAILIGLAVLGIVLLPLISQLRKPDPPTETTENLETLAADQPAVWNADLVWVLVAIGASVVAAWPFFVTYAADVYWPSANLGLVGAALVAGALGASAAWRPTEGRLLMRAKVAAVAMLASAVALVFLGSDSDGWGRGVAILGLLVVASGAGSVVRMSLLEMAHAHATESSSVSILTMLDVVASTALQGGFLVAGYLIQASAGGGSASEWAVDPFQLSLIVGAVLLLAALSQVKPTATR